MIRDLFEIAILIGVIVAIIAVIETYLPTLNKLIRYLIIAVLILAAFWLLHELTCHLLCSPV